MDFHSIAKKIIKWKNEDLALRDRLIKTNQLGDGYHDEMRQLHNKNADSLHGIINTIGYPAIEKVGKEAHEAAWLVVQHAIEKPDLMKKYAVLLAKAVQEQKANPKKLAYLTDRIAVFEERPQLYGTQFDWDASGRLSPQPYDNLTKVNERRKKLGLNSIEEQTEIMAKRAKIENQLPPADFEKRKMEMKHWKKQVGWT